MGKPTAAESTQLTFMGNIAEKLRNEEADQKTRDTALAMLLEVYIAERDLGLVSVTECERYRAEYASKCKGASWNVWKALSLIGSVAALAGAAIKIFG